MKDLSVIGKNKMNKNYTMYHCHTYYSLIDSCTSPKEYVDLCVENGMTALSISEHGIPYNWVEKWKLCKEAGIKYIHSVEIYLTESLDKDDRWLNRQSELDKSMLYREYFDRRGNPKDNFHTVLIAKNKAGVEEINRIVELSSRDDHFSGKNRITFDEFLNLSDNVITTSACLLSPLWKLPQNHPRYMELAQKYDYLEVQYHDCEEQKQFNKLLKDLSVKLDKPLIAGTDTHSASKYKQECRALFIKSKRKTYEDEDDFDLSFKTYDELVEMFKQQGILEEEDILQAIENTNQLAELCEPIELDLSVKYPISYSSREEDAQKLKDLVNAKFKEKLESKIIPIEQRPKFFENLREEMRVFHKLGMEGFMLSMSEICSWCRENGIVLGPGRGSVGGSSMAYVLDITDVNPVQWGTVFSRFCNEDREEIGD